MESAMKRPRTPRPTAGRRFPALRLEHLEGRDAPAVFTVTNLADAGPGSLRAAVAAANTAPGADTVRFALGLHGTIALGGEIAVTSDVTIAGPGANVITVSGKNATRVFDVPATAAVTIANLTIADGRATGDTMASPLGFPATLGGGILNAGGRLTLDGVTMTGNQAV